MPKAVQYKAGSVIYFETDTDDRIFILQRGTISLKSEDIETGEEIRETIKEGEFFGVKSVLGRFPREETAIAVTAVALIVMTLAEFEKLTASNGKITMKMLKVFSRQLRAIHKKTQTFLDSKEEIKPEDGMFSVAKAFYDDGDFAAAKEVCNRYMDIFKTGRHAEEARKLAVDAGKRVSVNGDAKEESPLYQTEAPLNQAVKQFFLPNFSRFAKTYAKGSVIFSEYEPGDNFYLIQTGRVRLVKCVKGCKKNLDILMPSEFFGEMAILENTPRSATAVALDTVELLEFNKANFEVLITGNPQIAMVLLRLFCKRIYDQKRRFKVLAITEKQARVGDVFLMLDETQPQQAPSEGERRFDITIPEIAQWAGMTVTEVTDEINRFVGKRKLEVYDTYIIVNNMLELRRFVESRRAKQKE